MSVRFKLLTAVTSPDTSIKGNAPRYVHGLCTALLFGALFVLPAMVFAQADDQSARLIPLPSPQQGLSFGLHWDTDIYDNLDGGVKRGYATDSVLSLGFGLDTGALGAWPGGQFALGLQSITSTHPSEYVGDIQTLSNLDAPNRRQVAEFWYSQAFGSALVRAGVMDVNSFFDVNDIASLFTNSSFGITPSITANVPTATYPDSAWGMMAQFGADKNGWLVGIFQGDPEHRSTALDGGEMLIAERDWRAATGGTQLGIGGWYRRVPVASGVPASDWGAYANLEQPLPNHPDTSAFVQIGASPGEVNTVPVYLGGGIRFQNVSPGVSDLGFGFARAWIRGQAAETSVETTALIPIGSGYFALQPDIQYVFHPSGIYPNAFVAALRLHLTLY
ncbi:MAG: carbohydrate porin [Gammaproteobacteria bacterium]